MHVGHSVQNSLGVKIHANLKISSTFQGDKNSHGFPIKFLPEQKSTWVDMIFTHISYNEIVNEIVI